MYEVYCAKMNHFYVMLMSLEYISSMPHGTTCMPKSIRNQTYLVPIIIPASKLWLFLLVKFLKMYPLFLYQHGIVSIKHTFLTKTRYFSFIKQKIPRHEQLYLLHNFHKNWR